MSGTNTLERVIELLQQRESITEAVRPDLRLDDLGVDSIDLVYLLTTFERTHDAEFTDAEFDLERYETVNDVALAIDARIHD